MTDRVPAVPALGTFNGASELLLVKLHVAAGGNPADDQLSWELVPIAALVGLAVSVALGIFTLTLTDAGDTPP